MKRKLRLRRQAQAPSAAFGRLRVETVTLNPVKGRSSSAAFGRLRVETVGALYASLGLLSAAFGRLRVETSLGAWSSAPFMFSRLRAAAC